MNNKFKWIIMKIYWSCNSCIREVFLLFPENERVRYIKHDIYIKIIIKKIDKIKHYLIS